MPMRERYAASLLPVSAFPPLPKLTSCAPTRMIPPLVNQSITQLKNTALLYVVAVPDLMYTSSIITAETYRPLEVYTSAAVIYFIILYPLTLFAKRLETRVDR